MDWTGWAITAGTTIVTGVATWWITRLQARLDEKRRMKRELLTQVIANRYDLKGEAFSQALNGAAVVYADATDVKAQIRSFHALVSSTSRDPDRIQAALLDVIRAMFDELDLPHDDLSDDFLLTPFNTRPSSAVPVG